MNRLLRAEWRKVFTTKLWWGMLLGSVAFAAIGVVAQIASNGQRGRDAELPLTNAQTQQSIFSSASGGEIFALIVGIIVMTAEFRHFTSRPTFLFEPRRSRVVVAKVMVASVVGLLYAICSILVTVAIATPWLAARSAPVQWTTNRIDLVLLGSLVVVTVYAVLGLGIGVLIQNQLAAVIGALAYLFILEPLTQIIPVVKEVYRFLPGAAAAAITSLGSDRRGTVLLGPWQGAFMLLGWGLLLATVGWLVSRRRDIP